jgi:hypothetical protein
MRNQNPKDTQSIRIPSGYYRALKDKAQNNKRPLVTELTIILDDYLGSITEPDESRKLKALSKVRGIIKNLPKKNYGQTIDEVLYGD